MADSESADLIDMARRDGVTTPPGETITGVTYVNGTRVYVSNKGGVFAPQGNFFGSYFTLPESARNDPGRSFNRIEATSSGYRIVSTNGEGYDFYNDFGRAPGSPPPAPAEAPIQAPSGPTAEQTDSRARVREILDSYGLGGLDGMAWDLIVSGAGDDEIMRQIRSTPEYKQRFQGLEIRKQNGFAPMSEAEYIAYENAAAQYMRSAGLPAGFYDDPSDFAELIGANVSLAELNRRVVNGYQAVASADPEVKAQVKALYGVSDGELVAFFLDPDRALPLLEQNVQAARIAAEAVRTGFGQLEESQASHLAQLGVTTEEANVGFGALANSRELFSPLPGEAGDALSAAEQIAAAFENNAQAQQKLSRRQRARQAEFEDRSGFVTTSGGSALGSA